MSSIKNIIKKFVVALFTIIHVLGFTKLNIFRNKNKKNRMLEIGPGAFRIDGFETLNVKGYFGVDYVADAAKSLPFKDQTYDLVYASHILEHVPWYKLESALMEWFRVIKSGGKIEIWVPNGLLICQTLVEAELNGESNIDKDGWYKFNEKKDPCVWANGRIFSYGNGTGQKNDPNWHMSLLTPRYLKELLETVGFTEVGELSIEEVRGYNHGWINLGMQGTKP